MQIFPHRDVDMGGGACLNKPFELGVDVNFNFNKEYLFGFETLVFAPLRILSMH